MSEHDEQKALCDWLNIAHPEVMYWANPNGAFLHGNTGQRVGQVNKLKSEGMLPGVSDLTIAEPRGGWHACFVEMKTTTGTVSENQQWFLAEVEKRGYYTIVGYGWEDASNKLQDYLTGKCVNMQDCIYSWGDPRNDGRHMQ